MQRRRLLQSLGLLSVAGCVSVGLTDGIGILLHPGYNPLNGSVSDLALGPFGWVQDIGLYLGAAGVIAYAIGLSLILSRQWEVRLGEFFLLLVGIGLLLAAVFHTDPPGHGTTIWGKIHGWASFASGFLALPTFFLVSPAIRDNKRLFIYTIAAGITQAMLEIGRGRLPSDWAYFGLHERLIGANGICWIIVMAWALLVESHRNQPKWRISRSSADGSGNASKQSMALRDGL